jgi:DNA polymerase-3 subunit delta'
LELLANSIRKDRISQAYLFYGPEGVGKFTTALYFGMALNCYATVERRPCGLCPACHKFLEYSSADFIYIFPTPNLKLSSEGEIKDNQAYNEYQAFIENRKQTPWESYYFSSNVEIRKESITYLQHQLEFSQHEGNYRICIVEDADEMNISTTNAFLKTLEEPPSHTVIILLTTKLPKLLPTIVSRCQLVYFNALPHKVIEDILINIHHVDKSEAKPYSRIAHGNLEQAIRLSSDRKHESRALMLTLVEAALKSDDLWLLNLVASGKEKLKSDLVYDTLSHLSIWFNDLAIRVIDERRITNLDHKDLLTACSAANPALQSHIIDDLLYFEDLQKKLEGNVNLGLVLINLFHYLKSAFHPADGLKKP